MLNGMKRHTYTVLVSLSLGICIGAIAGWFASSKLKYRNPNMAMTDFEERKSRFENAIVSSNPLPSSRHFFPENYDHKKQERVFWAIRSVVDSPDHRFEELVACTYSEKYCYSYFYHGNNHHVSVGDVCLKVLDEWLTPRPSSIEILCQEQLTAAGNSPPKHWWLGKKKEDRVDIVEIQLASLKRQLETIKTISYAEATPLDKRTPKLAESSFESRRAEVVGRLEAAIWELQRHRIPIRPSLDWLDEIPGRELGERKVENRENW